MRVIKQGTNDRDMRSRNGGAGKYLVVSFLCGGALFILLTIIDHKIF